MPQQPAQQLAKKSNVKKIVIAIVIFWVVAGVVLVAIKGFGKRNYVDYTPIGDSGPYASWVEYSSVPAGFSAIFPAKPSEVKDKMDPKNTEVDYDYYSYTAVDKEGSVFIVNHSKYAASVNMSKPENNLQNGLNAMIESTPGNELISSENSTFGDHKATEFVLANSGIGITMKGWLIAVPEKKEMYQLLYAHKGSGSEADFGKFVDSFKIK